MNQWGLSFELVSFVQELVKALEVENLQPSVEDLHLLDSTFSEMLTCSLRAVLHVVIEPFI